MTKENILKKMENENMREKLKKKETQENIDLCPNCNIAYCHGRYTTDRITADIQQLTSNSLQLRTYPNL